MAQALMRTLRLRCASLGDGVGDVPRGVRHIELIVSAADTLITSTQLPAASRSRNAAALAYAAEEQTVADAESQRVTWLGKSNGADVLAVIDRVGLDAVLGRLRAAGVMKCDVYCETLLVPLERGEWSVVWDGAEGFVRSGEIEGGATDAGDDAMPPLALRLMLEGAEARGGAPGRIVVYPTHPDAAPDAHAWESELGVPVRIAGTWDWRNAPLARVARLARDEQRWAVLPLAQLKPAAWIAGAALAIHMVALGVDWARLAQEERTLSQRMEARFRSVFPDAVAVADPALQMRRKLADIRHAANRTDAADFLPVIAHVAEAMKTLPAGTLREVSYESGRLRLRLNAMQDAALQPLIARLRQAGLRVEAGAHAPGSAVVLTVSGA
jgi:general secretion pathway protein L